MKAVTRRDFLKVSSGIAGSTAFSGLARQAGFGIQNSPEVLPNMLIFVFDAMSALDLSVYGYPRRTTPNLERFAERATVYRQHYSAGNFTTSGTASLLTGLYPWTHRAINMSGLVARELADQNLFRALGSRYYRMAFSQNLWPNYLFGQFERDLEEVLSPAAFSLADSLASRQLGEGKVVSRRALGDLLFPDGRAPGSMIFGLAERLQLYEAVSRAAGPEFPNGVPHTGLYSIFFRLKDVFDGLIATTGNLLRPTAAYLHLWSPHDPYLPTREFDGKFFGGWEPEPKPSHRLVDPQKHHSARVLNANRRKYDEYINNLDAEFGRLLDALAENGTLDRSYVIVTSDHGEQFERGFMGHGSALLYDPVVRIPLLISAPGQSARRDVHIPTTSVDVLPTLVHLSGGQVPTWCEGQILPGMGGSEETERSLFMMEAKTSRPLEPFTEASFAMRKGRYKLIDYMGYPQYRVQHRFEMYDMENDPEELTNIYSETMSAAWSMHGEFLERLEKAEAKYAR